MSSLQNTVTRIETRMEHEVIDKIRVLFDGYQFHEDRFDRIEKNLALSKHDFTCCTYLQMRQLIS